MSHASDVLTGTIVETAGMIERREISPTELVDAQLDRIDALDEQLHSYLLVTGELAREQARLAEREIMAGQYRGPLHGIPLGIKDLVATRGIPTTCGSPMLREHRPTEDAAVVTKLYAAGAVCLGKLNLTEFALYGYHPDFDYPRNPWQLDHSAGVSSSGSGAATAASLCFGAIGTDTGGSIRFPSAACGVVGLKPSFGKVSRHGVFRLAETLDHLGPMTRCVADAAIMLAAIEGRDDRDASTRSDPSMDYLAAIAEGARGLRVGIDRRYCAEDTDPAQAEATARACFMLRKAGVQIVDIDLEGLTAVCRHWFATCAVEALLNHREFFPARASEYGPAFRALLEYGLTVSAEDYARGQRERQATVALLDRALREVDCFVCPAAPNAALAQRDFPPQRVSTPEAVAKRMRFSAPTCFSGHPSLTVPNGFTADGLPTAMQFIGRLGDEATLFRVAAAYEESTEWHRRRPALASVRRP